MVKIDLCGKVALVTGGAKGIGREIVKALSESGAKVVINYFKSEREARNLVSELENTGGQSVAIRADVTRKNEVDNMINEAKRRFGKVDILVNNAGGQLERCALENLPEETWNRTMDLNLKSVFLCSQSVIPLMKLQGEGRIINISSAVAESGGDPGALSYVAAKGAVSTFTKGMSKEFAKYNITVNAVEPGIIDTDFYRELGISSEELKKRFSDKIPLGRVGYPKDIAGLVAFLASPQAHYITGSCILVTGGYQQK